MKVNTEIKPKVVRKRKKILRDMSRVITRLYLPGNEKRITNIIGRIVGLSETRAKKLLENVTRGFSGRHKDIQRTFEKHLNKVEACLPEGTKLGKTQKTLIGAFFTMEYAVESAALFNPSIVPHPDQSYIPNSSMRFIMSLRATGEGHISSIAFRSGVLDKKNTFHFDPISKYVETPELQLDKTYDRNLFYLKLDEMGADKEITTHVLNPLPDCFTYAELNKIIKSLQIKPKFQKSRQSSTLETILWLAGSNYQLKFQSDHRISERLIFPVSENESSGIEDARFVKFVDDESTGEVTYYATYTAYNGFRILPQLIETKDFLKFNILTLNGEAVHDKGMALFPRKINGSYVMLSRQDGENNHIMYSDNIHFWHQSEIIQEPEQPWEFVQIGNCGSPMETKDGWLVLTHGVGPMRKYCIGAMLLDLEDPSTIIARLDEPLITPNEAEREGYVPNVVYTCGCLIHNGQLIIPYAMSDVKCAVASVSVDELLKQMLE